MAPTSHVSAPVKVNWPKAQIQLSQDGQTRSISLAAIRDNIVVGLHDPPEQGDTPAAIPLEGRGLLISFPTLRSHERTSSSNNTTL